MFWPTWKSKSKHQDTLFTEYRTSTVYSLLLVANNKPHNWCATLIVITKHSNSKFRCDTFTTWLFFKVSYKCKQFMLLSCIYSVSNLEWDVSFLIRFFTNFWYKSKKRDSRNKNILVRQPRLHGISSQQEENKEWDLKFLELF